MYSNNIYIYITVLYIYIYIYINIHIHITASRIASLVDRGWFAFSEVHSRGLTVCRYSQHFDEIAGGSVD